jgi:hypothetical protein
MKSNSRLRILLVLSLQFLAAVILIKGLITFSRAQEPESASQGRKFKTKEFKDQPLEIVEVRNLQSKTWTSDLRIEVKNVSKKPIYFILAYLIFPDDKNVPSGVAGIPLTYGKDENGDIGKGINLSDDHFNPSESYVFEIPEYLSRGLAKRNEKYPESLKNMVLEFEIINFGDGTGFEAGRPLDLRGKGFKPPPSEKKVSKNTKRSHSKASTPSQSECGGSTCMKWKINTVLNKTFCWCSPLIGSPDQRVASVWPK